MVITLFQDRLHGFPGLFTNTSEQFFFFSTFQFLVLCRRLSWLASPFQHTLKQHFIWYRMLEKRMRTTEAGLYKPDASPTSQLAVSKHWKKFTERITHWPCLMLYWSINLWETKYYSLFNIKNRLQHNTNTVLWLLYRSTCINRHLQLRTGGLFRCKVLPAECTC